MVRQARGFVAFLPRTTEYLFDSFDETRGNGSPVPGIELFVDHEPERAVVDVLAEKGTLISADRRLFGLGIVD